LVLKSLQENRLEDVRIGMKVSVDFISIDGRRNKSCNARFRHVQNHIRQSPKQAA
jgi:hypothetical protein